MAQDVSLMGATYEDVPAVELPDGVGGTSVFYDPSSLDIPPHMTILKYGISTWSDFIDAYNSKTIVYCRASSNSNPASGSQTRMAFMAYVNNETTPTEVEFQYYRSVSTHTDSQQGDQVYVYKLNKNNGWSVTVRSAFSRVKAGNGLALSYATDNITLSSKAIMTSATLGSSGWSNNQKSITVTGVSATNKVIVAPAPASAETWAAAGVMCIAQGANSLTFKCTSTPTADMTVNVMYSS